MLSSPFFGVNVRNTLCVTADREQPRHPRPAAIGDLDPDQALPDRHRLPGKTRAAMPHTVAEKLASSTATSPADHAVHEGTGDPHPPRQPASVTLSRTRPPPLPWPPAPGTSHGHGRAHGECRLDSATHVKAERAPAAPVRGRPWKLTVHRTAPPSRTLSAICPWTPQHGDPQRYKVTHSGTKQNGPHSRESAANGPFSQVVAGGGFEPPKA